MTTEAQSPAMPRIGGISLIFGAVAFMAVFSYLAAKFNYPSVLDGAAEDVLPALLATGSRGRMVWAVYALLPLCWIPAAAGAFHALRRKSEGIMRLAMLFASISALAMVLGLMRWPSFHWELARTWAAQPDTRPALTALFNATNLYLGNYIGEFLGELSVSIFFLLSACAILKRDSGVSRWIGWLGVITAVAGLIAMFRNVTPSVQPFSAINNYLLPLWMIVFGIGLLRFNRPPQQLTAG
jgi:UDP-N-acetylmuramyl pentapeptide phosphotransferase/UDP-N-acetylglucosamine-1-phosphate transferase